MVYDSASGKCTEAVSILLLAIGVGCLLETELFHLLLLSSHQLTWTHQLSL